jgi:hypothetical protein
MNLLAFVPMDGYVLMFLLEIIFAATDESLHQHAKNIKGGSGQ